MTAHSKLSAGHGKKNNRSEKNYFRPKVTTPKLEAFEKKVEIPMMLLAVIMIATMLIPYFSTVTTTVKHALEIIDRGIWAAFFGEFCIRLALAPTGQRIRFSIQNWLDIIIILLPIIRVIRIFRALRILRSLRVVRSLRIVRAFLVFAKRGNSLSALSRKSKIDFIIILIAILMKPIALAAGLIFASLLLKETIPTPIVAMYADKTIWLSIIVVCGYLFNRLLVKEVLIVGIREAAKRSQSNFDIIITPIIQKLAPAVVVAFTVLLSLQLLGFNTSALSVLIGGMSFVIAFATQEALGNVVAGLFLSIDTPFKFGDLIELPDLGICEVKKIGIRATELYVMKSNTIVSMPNNTVSSATITNLSRPAPDLQLHLIFNLAYDTDISTCSRLITETLDLNPYVVGDPRIKIDIMKQRLLYLQENDDGYAREKEKVTWGIQYWQKKEIFKKDYHHFTEFLKLMSNEIGVMQNNGLDEGQQAIVRTLNKHLRHYHERVIDSYQRLYEINLDDPSLQQYRKEYDTSFQEQALRIYHDEFKDHRQPAFDAVEKIENYNIEKLVDFYRTKLEFLQDRMSILLEKMDRIKPEDELRLHSQIHEFLNWLEENFILSANTYEHPAITTKNYGAYTLDIQAEYFIWGIDLERFQRIERVESELRQVILTKFNQHGIEMPNPTQDINLNQS